MAQIYVVVQMSSDRYAVAERLIGEIDGVPIYRIMDRGKTYGYKYDAARKAAFWEKRGRILREADC